MDERQFQLNQGKLNGHVASRPVHEHNSPKKRKMEGGSKWSHVADRKFGRRPDGVVAGKNMRRQPICRLSDLVAELHPTGA